MSVKESTKPPETESVSKPETATDQFAARLLNPTEIHAVGAAGADTAEIVNYAGLTGLIHGHGKGKHDVRTAVNLRDEFVAAFFADHGVTPDDHAAPWLLSYRKEAALAHEEPLFADVADTDDQRWSRIESLKEKAPIPASEHARLRP